MSKRGYDLLCPPDRKPWTADDMVRFYEFIRLNIRNICPDIPNAYEFDLIAGGSPHCDGLVPFLGMHVPADLPCQDFALDLDNEIEEWLATIPPEMLANQIAATTAPSYDELCQMEIYPDRSDAG